MQSTLRGFEETYRAITSDIFKFAAAFNFKPTWQQAQLLQAVQDATFDKAPRCIAAKSGQGPGKTKAAALVVLFRTFRTVDGLTVATAPTMRQLRDALLAEIRDLVSKADRSIARFFEVTKSKVEIAGRPDWSVKLVTATREENAQGYHRTGMTVIGEEASGIGREIITQFKGTLSNPDPLLLLIGNPNTRDCAFFDCFNSQRHLWNTMTWNAEDTARDYPWLLNPARNAALADEFGVDSDVYRIRVKGQFPLADPNCVLSSEELELVTGKHLILPASRMERPLDCGGGLAKQFGMDFARFGGDEHVLFQRAGNAIMDWLAYSHREPDVLVDAAFRRQYDAGWRDEDTVFVADAGGIGQGIMHRFYNAHKRVIEFHNGNPAIESTKYANRITEGWFRFARLAKDRRCAIPADNRLIQQLCGRQYFTNKNGLLILETKDDYMKRGNDSPDRADGCVMAFSDHVRAVGNVTRKAASSHVAGVNMR